MKRPITVIKRNPSGEEVMRYEGVILQKKPMVVVLEARFNRADMPFMGITFKQGDRFVETYYSDRWYNIFEIHDRDDDQIKGWYCNIGRPAIQETENQLSYEDLALDLWIAADGTQTVLDEDEFAALPLDADTTSRARAALKDLQTLFSGIKKPDL
jgi:uncharacterized protein